MSITISPSPIEGAIVAPPSKSSMQRACAAALLTPGTTVIDHFGRSSDEKAAIDIIGRLGATVHMKGSEMVVESSDHIFTSPFPDKNLMVDICESGLSMRMFAPIAGLYNHDITFTGKGSILNRPMDFFEEVLPALGVDVYSNHGKLPITVHGPMHPKNISVSGALSSQFLTGMLFAFAKLAKKPLEIRVNNLKSTPYIDLTLSVLTHFGFKVQHRNYEYFEIHPRAPIPAHSIRYRVEGDWSNGAFLLVAGAIAGSIRVSGLDVHSSQGDKQILDALYACGAKINLEENAIIVQGNELRSFDFDATHCPDLFPPLVVLASYCKGTSVIKGVTRLLHKESNRAKTLKEEFEKMGGLVEYYGDIMKVYGGRRLMGAKVSSHNDHRIAMACAVAALKAKGNTEIDHAKAINKSYPGFYEDLGKMGATVLG